MDKFKIYEDDKISAYNHTKKNYNPYTSIDYSNAYLDTRKLLTLARIKGYCKKEYDRRRRKFFVIITQEEISQNLEV